MGHARSAYCPDRGHGRGEVCSSEFCRRWDEASHFSSGLCRAVLVVRNVGAFSPVADAERSCQCLTKVLSGWGPAVQVSQNSGVSGGWLAPLMLNVSPLACYDQSAYCKHSAGRNAANCYCVPGDASREYSDLPPSHRAEEAVVSYQHSWRHSDCKRHLVGGYAFAGAHSPGGIARLYD